MSTGKAKVLTAEQRLCCAVLKQAARDICSCAQIVRREHRRDAIRWLRSNSNDRWSYRWLCDVLDFDEDIIVKLRQTLLGFDKNSKDCQFFNLEKLLEEEPYYGDIWEGRKGKR
jgi:hypothetical protein